MKLTPISDLQAEMEKVDQSTPAGQNKWIKLGNKLSALVSKQTKKLENDELTESEKQELEEYMK